MKNCQPFIKFVPVCRVVCANNGEKPVASAVKKSAHKAKK